MRGKLLSLLSVFPFLFLGSSNESSPYGWFLNSAAASGFEHRFRGKDYNFTVSDIAFTDLTKDGAVVYSSIGGINENIIINTGNETVYFYDGSDESGVIVACRYQSATCETTDVPDGLNLFTYINDGYVILKYNTAMYGPIDSEIVVLQNGAASRSFKYDHIGINKIANRTGVRAGNFKCFFP